METFEKHLKNEARKFFPFACSLNQTNHLADLLISNGRYCVLIEAKHREKFSLELYEKTQPLQHRSLQKAGGFVIWKKRNTGLHTLFSVPNSVTICRDKPLKYIFEILEKQFLDF